MTYTINERYREEGIFLSNNNTVKILLYSLSYPLAWTLLKDRKCHPSEISPTLRSDSHAV
jgi:hypothetical protein